jgi:hypothetical protein
LEPLNSLVEQDVEDGQLLTPRMELCRQRIAHKLTPDGQITTSLFCISGKGHGDAAPHVSHPFNNIFSGELEYIIWRDDEDPPQVDFVLLGFDTFTCRKCHLDNEYHNVEEPCWNCGTMNPPSNYNFDP